MIDELISTLKSTLSKLEMLLTSKPSDFDPTKIVPNYLQHNNRIVNLPTPVLIKDFKITYYHGWMGLVVKRNECSPEFVICTLNPEKNGESYINCSTISEVFWTTTGEKFDRYDIETSHIYAYIPLFRNE